MNNAGIAIIKPFEELTELDIDKYGFNDRFGLLVNISFFRTFSVNFKALFNVTQQVVPLLISGSSIINVSSLAANIGIQSHSVYSASKAAVDSLTKSLALELGPRNIRVNSVNPTVVLTNMGRANWSDVSKSEPLLANIPLHRFAEINEVVEPIIYLLSNRSTFINGHCLPIEGGFSAC